MPSKSMKSINSLVALTAPFGLTALMLAARLVVPVAHAESSSAGEEFLSNAEAAPPNIIFVVDLSTDMTQDCGESDDDTSDTASPTPLGKTCLEVTLDAIEQLSQHYEWAYYGVVGTTADANDNEYYPIAPLGSSQAEIAAALNLVVSSGSSVRNMGESLSAVIDYVERADASDSCKSYARTSLVTGKDFCNVPLTYACQETHVISIAISHPSEDKNVKNATASSGLANDVMCDSTGIVTSPPDEDCTYDNVVHYAYNHDARSDLSDTQNIITHTIAIKVGGSSVAESLYGNSVDQISNEGVYTVANSGDEVLGKIMTIMGYIRAGFYSRSSPVVSADGEYVIYSFYEISGDNPLAEGHVRAYRVGVDPADLSTYGQIIDSGNTQFGGADWDAGDLLVSRPVITSESNPDDRDGLGQRDIYTFVEEMMVLSGEAVYNEGNDDHRMGFDYEFVEAVANNMGHLPYFLDNTDADSNGCADTTAYDLNKDGCDVDADDMQALVDFVRGLPSAEFRYLDQQRGYWKLGDSPHASPVVISARNNVFSTDPTYRKFVQGLEANDIPDMVYIPANDGMLHAFRLYDDLSTTAAASTHGSSEDADEAGEELWAWIPAYTIYREEHRDETWSGGLIDMMWYGRTFLFDGSPVVEDVWIDGFNDGVADGIKSSDGSEWRRVLVVQQGQGGPVTLALDITDPMDPRFLWEYSNAMDPEAQAYTVSRPVIANVYNAESSDPSEYKDTWVAMFGSGRAVPMGSSTTDYYNTAEAEIYMWHIAADYWGTPSVSYDLQGSTGHPENATSALDSDGDGRDEYGYISGSLAVVDVDSDGDVDVMYFPVTASYEPSDMGDPDGDGGSGTADVADPGYTWMYKAIINTADPEHPTWCEFYDPNDYVGLRPEVYYAATTSWHSDGALGVYWGTGTPYDRDSSDKGYFFAVKDPEPLACAAAVPIEDCGAAGAYELTAGEGLTADPVIYAGTVYFSTYIPASDRCTAGEGRIYGLSYKDCEGAIDTDGDGAGDASYITVAGYPSSVAISETGSLFYGSSNPDTSGTAAVGNLTAMTDPYLGTKMMGLREVF